MKKYLSKEFMETFELTYEEAYQVNYLISSEIAQKMINVVKRYQESQPPERQSKIEKAKGSILRIMGLGNKCSWAIYEILISAGITRTTIDRASKELKDEGKIQKKKEKDSWAWEICSEEVSQQDVEQW